MNKDFEMIEKYIRYIRRIGGVVDIYKGYTEEHFQALEKQIEKYGKGKKSVLVPPTYKYFLKEYGSLDYAPVEIIGFGPSVLESPAEMEIEERVICKSAIGKYADMMWHDPILPLPCNFLPVVIDDEWYHCIDLSKPDERGECPVFLVDFDGSLDDEHFSNANNFGEFLRKQFEDDFLPRAMEKAGRVKDFDEYEHLLKKGKIDFDK